MGTVKKYGLVFVGVLVLIAVVFALLLAALTALLPTIEAVLIMICFFAAVLGTLK